MKVQQYFKKFILLSIAFSYYSQALPHSLDPAERLSLDSKSAELQQLDFQAQPSFKWLTKDELKNYTLAPQSVFIQKGKAPCIVNNSADPSLLPSFIMAENSFNYSSLSNQPSFAYCDEDQKAFIRAGMEEAVYTQSLEEMLAERQLAAWPFVGLALKTQGTLCLAGVFGGIGNTIFLKYSDVVKQLLGLAGMGMMATVTISVVESILKVDKLSSPTSPLPPQALSAIAIPLICAIGSGSISYLLTPAAPTQIHLERE